MLTFLFFEAFVISHWNQDSFNYLWSKFTSYLLPVLSPSNAIPLNYEKDLEKFPDTDKSSSFETVMSIEDKFQAAVRVIHSLPKDGPYQPSNSTKLKFYGIFKQATDGPCNIPKPAFYDLVARYKWDAWKKLGDMGKEDAKNEYVESLKEIVETMSFNGDVQDFLESIGPFYEFVNLQGQNLNHVKEKIDRLTSSSSSSSGSSSLATNSLETSPINSCPNSPFKNPSVSLANGEVENDDEDDEEKSEVQGKHDTTTYETVVTKATVHQNGNGYLGHSQNGWSHSQNGVDAEGDFDSNFVIPPPTPMHTYGFTKRNSYKIPTNDEDDIGEETEGNENETIQVTNGTAICKEDLEKDPGYETGPTRVSNDTLTTTSGTESEKYYSGDSEPEVDERFVNYLSQKGASANCNPGSSRSIDWTNHAYTNNSNGNVFTRAQLLSSSTENKSKATSNGGGSLSRRTKEKSSPLKNEGLNQLSTLLHNPGSQTLKGEVVLQSTVERLNRDVEHILARLRILETAYATSAEGTSPRSPQRRRRLFGDLSKASVAFIVMWPFAVHFLIRLISWWRRRRMARSLTN